MSTPVDTPPHSQIASPEERPENTPYASTLSRSPSVDTLAHDYYAPMSLPSVAASSELVEGKFLGPIPRISNVNSSWLGSVVSYQRLRVKGDLWRHISSEYRDPSAFLLPVSARMDSLADGSNDSLVIHGGYRDIHRGHLWTIYRATLTIESATATATDHPGPCSIPVVVKILDTNADELSAHFGLGYLLPEDYGEYTPDRAYAEALNEDTILRRLLGFQGHFVPNYYGLYGSHAGRGSDTFEIGEDILVMVMEDVGEQPCIPLSVRYNHFSREERLEIMSHFDDLHERGHTAQGDRIRVRHILRRTNHQGHGSRSRDAFALVDFQDAMALENLDERQRDFAIACEDAELERCLGHPHDPG
ncbi:hypothetical protein I317_01511 [Kwoniella heveanensis CBS 569]|nr:hypothetical protein I317_01511 [Kwoniella heveanensis CBS 569]